MSTDSTSHGPSHSASHGTSHAETRPPRSFLRDHRLRRGIAPEELAERLGVHPTSVRRWERGERLPGPDHVRALAAALEVETTRISAFFDRFRTPQDPVPAMRGHGLRELRARAQLPAVLVAETVGVPPATVYNWERGRARLPADHLPALAEVFRLEVETLKDLLVRTSRVAPGVPRSQLRRMRHRSGLSQAVVAQRVGFSRHLVGSWERGARPPLVAVRRLATVYGVPVGTVARAAGVAAPALLDPRNWSAGDLPGVLGVLRRWSGLTQREVAAHCGCSVEAVRGWERGRAVPRQPQVLRRLEVLFGLSPDALVSALPRR